MPAGYLDIMELRLIIGGKIGQGLAGGVKRLVHPAAAADNQELFAAHFKAFEIVRMAAEEEHALFGLHKRRHKMLLHRQRGHGHLVVAVRRRWQPTMTSFTEALVSSRTRVCRYQVSCFLISAGFILLKLELSNTIATESTTLI